MPVPVVGVAPVSELVPVPVAGVAAGGARVLGLSEVGTLQVGQAADLVLYDINHPRFYGFHDPALAPVVAGEPITVRTSIIGGRVVVDEGVVCGLDVASIRAEASQGVADLMSCA